MKKKALAFCVIVLAALVLAEPHVQSGVKEAVRSLISMRQENEQSEAAVPSFSQQIGGHDRTDMLDVTLYYRFADTEVLGAQRAQLDIRREETVATSIVQQLIDGPDMSHPKLGGVFPQGTELISVSGEDTTAFVTLSARFLGKPDGAPADWEDSFAWQEEAALRRRLAVQSIVLALTEGGRYQRVQLYVADSDDDIPQRVPMVYFDPYAEEFSVVLGANSRDESAMLTPQRTMEMILEAWRMRDEELLHAFLAPEKGEELPALSVFAAEMNRMDISLLSGSASAGTVSIDGKTATVVVDAFIRSGEGGDAQIRRESVPLVRMEDNWAIGMDTLQSLMIRD